MEDELAALGYGGLTHVVADLLLAVGVDTGDVGALELEELLAETEVETRRLELGVEIVDRVDDEVALLHAAQDVAVREDHTGEAGAGGA
ncbi:hypothetical protein SY89_01101 [Halolamina pelagica]|uniref:Uncharacterized protein n=1 Tax=Halolamina pelagica TaxID=699431 RepID=A0A0P7I103_9EURY|nr:hypothetical protein SY89_01101 [Halolamina pelagica]